MYIKKQWPYIVFGKKKQKTNRCHVQILINLVNAS